MHLGDRADRKGALTGGYHDHRTSRLENIKNLKMFRAKLEEEEQNVADCKRQSQEIEQEIVQCRNEIRYLEQRRKTALESRDPMLNEIGQKQNEENMVRDKIAQTVSHHFVSDGMELLTIICSEPLH